MENGETCAQIHDKFPKLICKSIKITDKTKERRNRYDPYEHL